jgi:exodeoxyribonuclease-5
MPDTTPTRITLTPEQSFVAETLLKRYERDGPPYMTLGGYAGSGKSTLLQFLLPHLPLATAVCCPTGKAASVLRSKGIPQACTIHSLFYCMVQDEDGKPLFFKKSKEQIQKEVEFIVIDEASMVNQQVHDDLLSYEVPILYVGDHAQLPPVGIDPGLMRDPMFKLETIHRQALDSPIIRFAHHIRQHGGPPPRDEPPAVRYRKAKDHDLFETPAQILTSFNNERVALNKLFREAWGRRGLLAVGDRVICLRNNPEWGLYNGTICEVTAVYASRFTVRADLKGEDGTVYPDIPINKSAFDVAKPDLSNLPPPKVGGVPFDYAYAITGHKSQGSQWPAVLIYERETHLWESRRWLYTTFTRAEKEVTLVR